MLVLLLLLQTEPGRVRDVLVLEVPEEALEVVVLDGDVLEGEVPDLFFLLVDAFLLAQVLEFEFVLNGRQIEFPLLVGELVFII